MSDQRKLDGQADLLKGDSGDNTISPLPGEAGIPNVASRPSVAMSKKGLLAVGLMAVSLVAVSAFSAQRFIASHKKADDGDSKLVSDRPSAATADPRRLEMPAPAVAATSTTPRIPALLPTAADSADPIGVRRNGQGAGGNGGIGNNGIKPIPPEDAPILVVSSRPGANGKPPPPQSGDDAEAIDPNDPMAATSRNLQNYQRQLQGLLDSLTKTTADVANPAAGQATGTSPMGATPFGLPPFGGTTLGGTPMGVAPTTMGAPATTPTAALFGGQLQGSATPRVVASMLGDRSLTLPKGTAFTCALKTKVISATSGLVGCQVQRNVFSDDGRVLLIERGSHLDGEYRISSVRPGTVRIPVLWTRIRTPNGVTVDIDSPGTGPLGESGIDGYVDNRWGERLGAAMLLSLIDDSVKLVIQSQANRGDDGGSGNTILLPSTTANSSKLAEKVLDSTINIPPLIYQNQGGIVGIYVARDVDFSAVYELKPSAR